jgi:hypothetical protein
MQLFVCKLLTITGVYDLELITLTTFAPFAYAITGTASTSQPPGLVCQQYPLSAIPKTTTCPTNDG